MGFYVGKKEKSLSHAQFFATSGTVAYQAPPSMGSSRQKYWSGLPFPLIYSIEFQRKVFYIQIGSPGGSDDKESARSAGDLGLIPRSGRSPGKWNGNPLQYSFLENHMDQGAWCAYSPWSRRVRHNWVTEQQHTYCKYQEAFTNILK